ncbi:MAG: hypothetical protein H7317_14280 [Pseudorhodobacter sp.]|nr:hypothetical protein [Pseudorhodobacter sp.]
MRTNFLAEWEQMKKNFDAGAKSVHTRDPTMTAFLAVMAKPTARKDIDAAFAKEQRKAATQALLKFYGKLEPISKLLAKMVPKITDDALNDAAMDLMAGLPALEKSMQTKIRSSMRPPSRPASGTQMPPTVLMEFLYR